MDAEVFDALTRSFRAARSRRGMLLTLLGLGTASEVARSKRAAKKSCPPCKKRNKGKCKRKLPDGAACPGGTCLSGRCVAATSGNMCPAGQKPCRAACILSGECCTSSDCPTGTTCCDQLCTDTATDPRHCGDCPTICSAPETCAGGHCCTVRGEDCTPTSTCCGTDACSKGLSPNTCQPCSPNGAGCVHDGCCSGLFCIDNGFTEICVSCLPEGESCQNSSECCTGLFCQSNGKCAEPVTG